MHLACQAGLLLVETALHLLFISVRHASPHHYACNLTDFIETLYTRRIADQNGMGISQSLNDGNRGSIMNACNTMIIIKS